MLTDKQELGFQESKITLVKLNEPYKIKLCPFAKGYRIELTLNGNEYLADKVRDKEGEIVSLIRATKELIKEELEGVLIRDELE